MCFGQRLVAESRHVHQPQSIIILGAVGYGGPTFSGHIEPTKGGFVDKVLLLYILTYTYLWRVDFANMHDNRKLYMACAIRTFMK